MKRIITISTFLALILAKGYTQLDYVRSVDFTIRVVDDSTSHWISNPRIVIFSTYESFRGDSLGIFQMQLLHTDSIRITALGYWPKTVKIRTLSQKNITNISLKPYNYILPEVVVRNKLDTAKINLHLPKDILNKKRNNVATRLRPGGLGYISSNPIGMVFNPISTINYLTNKKEKHKRETLKFIEREKYRTNNEYQILNRQIIEEESGLVGDSLQQFIVQCNIKISPKENSLNIRQKIRELANEFRKAKITEQNITKSVKMTEK